MRGHCRSWDPEAARLIDSLRSDFESQMNDDLQVKKAFDGRFITVSQLAALAAAGRLSRAEANRALRELRRIDTVLNVIG